MISSFKDYLVEEEKTVFFTWGRMNPPTIGHGKLLDKLSQKSGSNPYRIYVTQSNDLKSNPLKYSNKIKVLRKMFPKHARSIILDRKVKTVFHALTNLYNEGFKRVAMVVGSDRIRSFDTLLRKYNGKKSTHGLYNFEKISVLSAGERDPDAEGVTGISASKMRYYASKGDFTSFSQGLPKNVSNADSKSLYNMVRKGMGLKEEKFFKRHLQLESVSQNRESYIRGDLYKVDDEVVIKSTGEIGKIALCGSNYVIVEVNEMKFRKWLEDIEKVNEDPSYYGGTSGYKVGKPRVRRMSSLEKTKRRTTPLRKNRLDKLQTVGKKLTRTVRPRRRSNDVEVQKL